jgi:Protein of unknown function (DUF3352)
MMMPRILLTLTALLTAIVVTAGCGSDESSSSAPAGLAPAGSVMYGEATLKPEGDQKAAIDSLVEKFPGQGSAGDRIRSLMEKAFAESDSGLSYGKDVAPWLGDEAAFFLTHLGANGEDGDGGLLVATNDEEKAKATLDKAIDGKKAEYKGTEYFTEDDGAAGVVDGWVVIATVPGFKAAVDVAGDGRSLEDDEDFQKTLEDAPEERLGYFYINSPAFVKSLEQSPAGAQLGQFREFFKEPFLATIDADDSGVRFEATVPKSLAAGFPVVAEGADLAGGLPGDAWLAMAQPDLGKTLDRYVELFGAQLGGRDNAEQQFKSATGLDLQDDVLSWMGDWALFVRGTSVSELSGALIIETSDETKSGRVIDTIARFARQNADPGEQVGPLELDGGGEGVTLRTPDVPQPIHLFQRDGKVVLAYGDEAAADAISPGQTLADTAEFAQAEDALGGDYNVSFYLAVEPILALVDSTGASSDAEWAKVKPYLEPLGALVGGAQEDGDNLRSAFGVTVK